MKVSTFVSITDEKTVPHAYFTALAPSSDGMPGAMGFTPGMFRRAMCPILL